MREVDVAVIGAGPAGLFAAYYAGFRGLSVAVVDALPEPGGQITAMYPEKLIHDVAGFPAVKGRDLIANLVAQAAPFDPRYLLGTRAEKLSYADGRPVLGLAGGEQLGCGAVIVTGGLGSFTPRPLPVAEHFAGTGIVYFVPQPTELAGRDVLIVGGGDSAFDWALTLQPLARSVTLAHRREKFRAHAATVARVLELPVRMIVNAEVTGLHGDGAVTGAEITVRGGAAAELLPVDTVVAALGFTADLGPLAEWGLRLDRRHIVVDSAMATNLPRVFAAIDPSAHLFPGHSSDGT
ncbi:NAD(P)/FAD-dependent oxidoreductase [Micromonospora sp. NPDC052213]|uniref:NAD(P)/FAD-dependent oxidoreductase n=1 Tax=Micromonospora sp. NPDC052213 TaxID=3155812 RepID=UPI0034290159